MTLLPTTLVGSYPQPDWLIDRKRLAEIVPPRAKAPDLWRVDGPLLEQAQDDATILAVRDQERARLDVVTDGEMRRESYSNRFATALDGMDSDHPAEVPSRTPGRVQIVPRVVGPLRRSAPVQVAQQFLAALAHDWEDRLEALRDHLDKSASVTTTTKNRLERKETLR